MYLITEIVTITISYYNGHIPCYFQEQKVQLLSFELITTIRIL